jgi:hypothetical protein
MGSSVVGLAGDQSLAIAQADASRVYRDLSMYRIQLVLEGDGWHVGYELKHPGLKGGGPHYIIDAHTGAVVSRGMSNKVAERASPADGGPGEAVIRAEGLEPLRHFGS